jgi:beta-1,4-mannosyltransferase
MRVLESVAPPGATTKFIDQVVLYAPSDIDFEYFNWRQALFGRYDVLHVHWPEFLIRSRHRYVAWMRRVFFRTLLHRIRRRNTPVVRTLHNVAPHEAGSASEAELLAELDRLTTNWVTLNSCTPIPSGRSTTLIPHGDYQGQFESIPRSAPIPGRLLFVGRIEPYKGVEELVDAFRTVAKPGDSLRIVGQPTEAMRARLEGRLHDWDRTDATLSLRLDFVSDADLVHEVSSAEAVVLPYREMHNSGIALVALSLGRPIVVPAGCTNEALAAEVGVGWVIQYPGEFSADRLRASVDALASGERSERPNLSGRDWRVVGEMYARVFRESAASIPLVTAH